MVFDAFMMKKAGKTEKYNGFQCFIIEKDGKTEKYNGFQCFSKLYIYFPYISISVYYRDMRRYKER